MSKAKRSVQFIEHEDGTYSMKHDEDGVATHHKGLNRQQLDKLLKDKSRRDDEGSNQ